LPNYSEIIRDYNKASVTLFGQIRIMPRIELKIGVVL